MAKSVAAKKVTTSKTKKVDNSKNLKSTKSNTKSNPNPKNLTKKSSKIVESKIKKQVSTKTASNTKSNSKSKATAKTLKSTPKTSVKATSKVTTAKVAKVNKSVASSSAKKGNLLKENGKKAVSVNKGKVATPAKNKKDEKLVKQEKQVKSAKVTEKVENVKQTIAIKPNNDSTLSYTQLEFYDNIKAFCGLEKRAQAKEICDDITSFILDALSKGYKVPFLGLGKLYVRKTKARIGRNPTTGEIVHIKAKSRVRFAPAKSLVDFTD